MVLKRTDASNSVITDMRTIKNIHVEHHRRSDKITTDEGADLKDIGRNASTITLEGEILGVDAAQSVGELRKKFTEGKTIEFVSGLVMASDISNVVIEELKVDCVKGRMSYFKYSMRLREDIQLLDSEI